MDLDSQPLKLGVAELPVGGDETDGGVFPRLARPPIGIAARRNISHEVGNLGRSAPIRRGMARNKVATAIDDRTEGVDDDESGDLDPVDLAKRRALAGMGAADEKVSLYRHASRALRPEREHSRPQRLERRL